MNNRIPMPNTDNLFKYLKGAKWHFITANFAGFVKKEFDSVVARVAPGAEIQQFKTLRMLIQLSEMGNYTQAKDLLEKAQVEYEDLLQQLLELQTYKTPRQPVNSEPASTRSEEVRPQVYNSPRQEVMPPHYSPDPRDRQKPYTPEVQNRPRPRTPEEQMNRQKPPYTPDHYNRRDDKAQYPPDMSDRSPRAPVRENGPYHSRDPTESTRPQYDPPQHERSPAKDKNAYHRNDSNRPPYDSLKLPDERSPRTPVKEEGDKSYRAPENQPDPHKVNYDNLRLKSPEQRPGTNHSLRSSRDQEPRLNKRAAASFNQASQMASHAELWGRDHGDKEAEKVGDSTYRQTYHAHSVDSYDRMDRDRYRENFGPVIDSVNERYRFINTPEHDENRPSELARRFKELYLNEWTDAYDEIVKDFGAEKTIRHLLWIITDASTIAKEIADVQLRDLERKALGVMTAKPGADEAWLICLDIADKQLKDLEKSAMGIMESPGPEHHPSDRFFHVRHVPDTLPTSMKLLLKYRRQAAVLSIPYVKQECRDKICRTLMESSGFPKHALTDASRLVSYINKGAELVWLMSVQDPPIVLEYINRDTEGARFNSEHYNPYTQSGTVYQYGVWPMLRQGKKGPIISRGIAQGM